MYVLIYRNTCPTECEATSSLAVRAQPLWRPLHGERRVGDRLLEISLGDVFYPQSGDHSANVSYRNQITQKHVDFLLCDPGSMRPLLGVELDDASHERPNRQDRDIFVDKVFAAAGLPLLRVPVQAAYDGFVDGQGLGNR